MAAYIRAHKQGKGGTQQCVSSSSALATPSGVELQKLSGGHNSKIAPCVCEVHVDSLECGAHHPT